MTADEARAILGPAVVAQVKADAANDPPLTPAQITLLAGLLAIADPDVDTDAA